jgi:hypothetical protein
VKHNITTLAIFLGERCLNVFCYNPIDNFGVHGGFVNVGTFEKAVDESMLAIPFPDGLRLI